MKSGPRLLIVNYHYVRDPEQYAYPGIHPIGVQTFRNQMEELGRVLEFVTPEDVEAYAFGKGPLPERGVLITFDDGLTDHLIVAEEVLNELDIKAAFFVCSKPLIDKQALMVHKIHWLRATTAPEVFRSQFMESVPDEWRRYEISEKERDSAWSIYVYDEPQDKVLKYFINFVLPESVVDSAASRMLQAGGMGEQKFCERTYMDPASLVRLRKSGHCIGAHTHSHRPVTRLGEDEKRDINLNVKSLEDIVGVRPTWFSFPHGRGWALPQNPASFCKKYDFTIGITLTRRWVDPDNVPYALDRINTNEVHELLAKVDA